MCEIPTYCYHQIIFKKNFFCNQYSTHSKNLIFLFKLLITYESGYKYLHDTIYINKTLTIDSIDIASFVFYTFVSQYYI